ncbi:MAG: hypothetical protein ACSHXF_13585 [Aquaticitalea sp.]
MKTQEKKGTSFDAMKEGFSNSNKVANQAIAEHKDAASQMSNPETAAQPQKKHITSAKAGSAKLKDPNKVKASKKRSVNEAGISENVYNGETMVDVLNTFEPPFNPINAALSPASLTAKNVAGRAMLNEVRDNKQHKTDEGNARRGIFDVLNKKFTRVYSQISVCGAPEGTVTNAKSILDLMRARRKGKPKAGAKTKSISQKSFNKMIDHVSDFLVLLANCPEYDSNVQELKLIALEAYRDSLMLGNGKANQKKAVWNTSLNERNEFFNAKNTGFVDTFQAAKRSVKAEYGADSTQYHQVAHFKFKRIYS